MIYPQAVNNASAGGSAGKRAGKNSSIAEKRGVARKNGKGGKPQQVVQWKQKNVEEGIVVVDELQLSKLIKREPIEKHYKLDPEPFATGLFASVRRCVSLDTGEAFAAKFSSRARYGEDCSAEIHHEIALLSLCAPSPRIVKLHDVFETSTEIIILMQFAPGGDLQTVIDDNLVPFEADVVNFVRQLVEGLAYLHERKIAHLDIKPQNLVMMGDFPNCDVKLCDFEISRVILEGTEIREILGTPDYVAPEILHYEPITLAADLWSLGVTTYVLLTGFSPFGGETDQETFCNISRAQLDFPEELFEDVSQDAKDFIRQLLVREPGGRPTAKTLLRHRWLSRQGPAPRRASPAPGEKNLRKYLSKSREALFERVVQQQRNNNNNDLRKTTLLSQYNKKTRMCESHTSLVSRTRDERPLIGLSPSFSRSREKLYGLRSLSRSHEGLDLLSRMSGGGGRRGAAYTGAVTAELPVMPGPGAMETTDPAPVEGREKTFRKINSDSCISVPSSLISPALLRNTLEQCGKLASTTTLAHIAGTNGTQNGGLANNEEELCEPTSNDKTTLANSTKFNDEEKTFDKCNSNFETSLANGTKSNHNDNTQVEPKYETTLMNGTKFNDDDKTLEECNSNFETTLANGMRSSHNDKTQVEPKYETTLVNRTKFNDDDKTSEDCNSNFETILANGTKSNHNDKPQVELKYDTTLVNSTQLKSDHIILYEPNLDHETTMANRMKPKDSDKTLDDPISNYVTTMANRMKLLCVANAESKEDTSTVASNESKDQANGASKREPIDEGRVEGKGPDTAETTQTGDQEGEPDDEPTFTVAQLISAYNRHQEVVTKTSLEVTMTCGDKPLLVQLPTVTKDPSAKFPTGPTALRLFIPDIDIETTNTKKKNRTKSYRTLVARSSVVAREAQAQDVVCPAGVENGVPASRDLGQTSENTCGFVADTPAVEKRDGDGAKRSLTQTDFLRSVSLSSETSGGLTPGSETLSSLSWEEVNVVATPSTADDAHWSAYRVVTTPPTGDDAHWSVDHVVTTPPTTDDAHWSVDHVVTTPPITDDPHWSANHVAATPPTTDDAHWSADRGTNNRSAIPRPPRTEDGVKRLCTGSYTRAIERFRNGPAPETKPVAVVTNARKCSLSTLFPPRPEQDEKVRRKSTSVIVKLS